MKGEIKFDEIIESVRREISDKGERIACEPHRFSLAWWPDSSDADKGFPKPLYSNMGMVPGPKQVEEEFWAEVKAIKNYLKQSGLIPDFENSKADSYETAGKNFDADVTRLTKAWSIWEQIAIPVRKRGDYVFHISPPLGLLGGPVIEAMTVDEYLRGLLAKTSADKLTLTRMRIPINLWRFIRQLGTKRGLKRVLIGLAIAFAFIGFMSLQTGRNLYIEYYQDWFGLSAKSPVSEWRTASETAKIHWLNKICDGGRCLDRVDWKCGFDNSEDDEVLSCFVSLVKNAARDDTLGKLRLLCGRKYMAFVGETYSTPDECAKIGGQWGQKIKIFGDEDAYFK